MRLERICQIGLSRIARQKWATSLLAAVCIAGSGFSASAKPKITTFDPEGSVGTFAYGINKSGVIAGSYEDSSDAYHGFVRAADGKIVAFDPPDSMVTEAYSINNAGSVAGDYQDTGGMYHCFVRQDVGAIQPVKVRPE
jgi:uncharacterized membrane protein